LIGNGPGGRAQSPDEATNRWLGITLQMGNLHEVSRKVAAWTRQPDRSPDKKLQ
jgi:hypothetical protein